MMERLASKEGKEVWLQELVRPSAFVPPFNNRRYVGMVFAGDDTISKNDRDGVCQALFSSGCRFGLFAGKNCEGWEWAMDTVCIESSPDYHPADEDFTMTTSHVGESVEDVLFFGLVNTQFGDETYDRFLVLFVGPQPGLREEVVRAIQAAW